LRITFKPPLRGVAVPEAGLTAGHCQLGFFTEPVPVSAYVESLNSLKHLKDFGQGCYKGISLARERFLLGPYRRPMPRALQW
jgi:hypothetical protein